MKYKKRRNFQTKNKKGYTSQLDKKAINLVNKLPKWNPRKIDGITVNVKCFVPIDFKFSQ